MKRAFTLIEVMVAVMLLSVVGWSVLQSQQGSAFTVQGNQKSFDTALFTMPVLLLANKAYHNKERTLYEFLRTEYEIKDQEVVDALKQQKVHYSQEEFEFIAFEQPEANTTHSRVSQEQIAQAASQQGVYIDRVIARTQEGTASVYIFRVQP